MLQLVRIFQALKASIREAIQSVARKIPYLHQSLQVSPTKKIKALFGDPAVGSETQTLWADIRAQDVETKWEVQEATRRKARESGEINSIV